MGAEGGLKVRHSKIVRGPGLDEDEHFHWTSYESWPFVFDEQWRLVDELPCPACGYNLRGTLQFGRCAECGVDLVAAYDKVVDRADGWLRTLWRARVVIIWTLPISLAALCVWGFLAVFVGVTVLPLSWWFPAIMLTVGWGLLIARWPATFGIDHVDVARWTSLGLMAAATWGFALQFQMWWWAWPDMAWMGPANVVLSCLAVASGWWYCRRLRQALVHLWPLANVAGQLWRWAGAVLAALAYFALWELR